VGHQGLDFNPGTVRAEAELTQSGQARVPIPLERIEAVRRNGVMAFVIESQNALGFLEHVLGIHGFSIKQ
jgi:hypothetical protein